MNATKLDAMMEAMQQVEQDLRDYKWMNQKIIEYNSRNKDDDITIGTSKYGIETSLPKSNAYEEQMVLAAAVYANRGVATQHVEPYANTDWKVKKNE